MIFFDKAARDKTGNQHISDGIQTGCLQSSAHLLRQFFSLSLSKFIMLTTLIFLFVSYFYGQTIRVNPTGVNVNSQNPTAVFLTFGQIPANYVPAEAIWCGELIPAVLPSIGLQCRPDTIYGSLPVSHNFSQTSGNLGFTDIMSIPPSVVRRAYFDAVRGANAGFFYVRRFVSTNGQPDQYVNVTCRMTGGGARVPFALTEVQLLTETKEPILFLKHGEKFPQLSAEIKYNGTGRLKGRWEIVQPGEDTPTENDLLTEATLPIEDRASQKRYTQIERFDHFLPPSGSFTLKIENPDRIPLSIEGQYYLLLRIEAADDKESDSNLQVIGVGNGTVHSGAVAGFPMPALKFFVGGGDKRIWENTALLLPNEKTVLTAKQPIIFSWRELPNVAAYRLEILETNEEPIFFAILPSTQNVYHAPSWFVEKFGAKTLRWRVTAIDEQGNMTHQTITKQIKF